MHIDFFFRPGQAEFGAFSLWEDEEQKYFYEEVTDIKPFIPSVRPHPLLIEINSNKLINKYHMYLYMYQILYETSSKRKKTDSSSSDPGTSKTETSTENEETKDEKGMEWD